MKNKIGFLILHYYALKETLDCVESIKSKIDNNNYEIVIVDNNSLNKSGKELKKIFKKDKKIHVILNKKNEGFARGNNIGFKYLKNKLECDFIVMLNNDILIKTEKIYEEIINEYKKSNFAVMGPKIYDKNNNLCFVGEKFPSIKQLKKDIFILKILYLFTYLRIIKILMHFIKKEYNYNDNCNNGIRKENVMLHGCFLIFSPLYINKYDGIDDRTFLFREEELLYLRLQKNNLKNLYNPNIEIIHLEDVSTNKCYKNFYKKKLNTYYYQIKSSKILLRDLILEEQNNGK